MASSSGSGRVNDQQVAEFMGLTGATKEVAEFHLEAAAGRLDVAVEAFYGAWCVCAPMFDTSSVVIASLQYLASHRLTQYKSYSFDITGPTLYPLSAHTHNVSIWRWAFFSFFFMSQRIDHDADRPGCVCGMCVM